MLGGDRAAHPLDDGVDDPVEAAPLREEGRRLHADRLGQVEVDVAVPEMPERTGAQARHLGLAGGRGLLEEVGEAGQRHRNVVLDRAALRLLHPGQRFAQAPEGGVLGGAAADGGILHQSDLHGLGQQRLQVGPRVRTGARRGQLDQGVGGVAPGQRRAHADPVPQHHLQAEAGHVLEGRQPPVGAGAQPLEQGERRPRRGQPDEADGLREGPGEQLQGRRGDDAERPLRADEEVLEVVARIVLAQGLEPVPDPPVGEHDFEPEHEVAGIAVGEHGEPPGIGGQPAADPRRALRRPGEREQHARGLGRRLHVGQDHAGLHRHRGPERIDGAQPGEAVQGEHDPAEGHAAADEAGIAPLGHHRHPRRGAGLHGEGDFLGRARGDDGERVAAIEPARLDEVRRQIRRIGADMARAQPLGECGEKASWESAGVWHRRRSGEGERSSQIGRPGAVCSRGRAGT